MQLHQLTTKALTASMGQRATVSAIFGRSAAAPLKADREAHTSQVRYCGVKRGITSCLVQTGLSSWVSFCCSLSVSGTSPAPALTQTTELLPPNRLLKLRPRRLPRTDASGLLSKFRSPLGLALAETEVSARRISSIRNFSEHFEVRISPLTHMPRNRERTDAAA